MVLMLSLSRRKRGPEWSVSLPLLELRPAWKRKPGSASSDEFWNHDKAVARDCQGQFARILRGILEEADSAILLLLKSGLASRIES
jgi:hypothetical protein